jgi:hypothetical protein
MRQKTINFRNQGSFDKKIDFFSPDPKSRTQMGSLRAKNASEKFSRLGTFKAKKPLFMSFSPQIFVRYRIVNVPTVTTQTSIF